MILIAPLGRLEDPRALEDLARRLGIRAHVSIWPINVSYEAFDFSSMRFVASKVNRLVSEQFGDFAKRGGLVVVVSSAEGDRPFLLSPELGVLSVFKGGLGAHEEIRLSLLALLKEGAEGT